MFWAKCIAKLQKDWEEAILTVSRLPSHERPLMRGMQATVLLNANISLLTINDVDSGTGPRTPAQLASYVSTIASISAVIVALLLIRQHRVSPEETATDAVRLHGYLEPLTVIHVILRSHILMADSTEGTFHSNLLPPALLPGWVKGAWRHGASARTRRDATRPDTAPCDRKDF